MIEEIFISIDIETGGQSPKLHPLLAIGAVVAKPGKYYAGQVEILERAYWCLEPFPEQTMEERCVQEFWSNYADVLNRIKANAVEPIGALKSFSKWLDGILEQYPSKKVSFVSDNPLFDLGFLDTVLIDRGIRTSSIRNLGGVYRFVCDPSEMQSGLGDWTADALARQEVEHDHWPVNDAEFIMRSYFHALCIRDITKQKIRVLETDVMRLEKNDNQLSIYSHKLEFALAILIGVTVSAVGISIRGALSAAK